MKQFGRVCNVIKNIVGIAGFSIHYDRTWQGVDSLLGYYV